MNRYYTDERQAQIVISLLKQYGIRKVVASPGTTNLAFLGSIQNDSFFEIYSSVDERSAAYIACGLSEESGEPVVLTCTGATASRNYIPGLTEAFYRKLPLLALTSTQDVSRIGHHVAQVIDRSVIQNDIAVYNTTLPIVKDNGDLWDCEIKVNCALQALTRNGGGPVHINLPTRYSKDFSVQNLPEYRKIEYYTESSELPDIPAGMVAIFVGSHSRWSNREVEAIDSFCQAYDAVVFCDHTSNYKGRYRVLFPIASHSGKFLKKVRPDLLIHIGEVTGDYCTTTIAAKRVWRVSEDGKIRDFFKTLSAVFEMSECSFFEKYAKLHKSSSGKNSYLTLCQNCITEAYAEFSKLTLPFSNLWIASIVAPKLPENSVLHLGILNSLRSWNYFEIPRSVLSYSNVGGFGIDGGMSSCIGASLIHADKLYFLVIGDLAFFYDLNSLGNRHISNNLRVLLINNGKGTEFRNFNHPAQRFGDNADNYMAAAGHYGNKSMSLIRNYSQDLGFKYLCATNKSEFLKNMDEFVNPNFNKTSIVFEVFTDSQEESDALKQIFNTCQNQSLSSKTKSVIRSVLGDKGVNALKKFLK